MQSKKIIECTESTKELVNQEDELWEDGYFIQKIDPENMKDKMRTFDMKHDEELYYDCKKCNAKISAHNRDWHAGLCYDCFNMLYGD